MSYVNDLYKTSYDSIATLYSMKLVASAASGSKTLNTDIITDLDIEEAGVIKVLVNVGAAAKLKATLDGTNFFVLNNDTALTVDALTEFNFPVNQSNTVNFQVDTTVQVDILDVYFFK